MTSSLIRSLCIFTVFVFVFASFIDTVVICEDDTTQLVLSHLPSWPDRCKSPRLHMTLVWFGKNTPCLPLEKKLENTQRLKKIVFFSTDLCVDQPKDSIRECLDRMP